MANLNAPRGFTPVQYAGGIPQNGRQTRYYKGTTAGILGIGDPVVRLTASSDPAGGPEVVRATTGSYITGVVVAIDPVPANLQQVGYYAAADTGYLYVNDDPTALFEVQEGGSGTVLTVATAVGQCINSVTALNADTTIGHSKYQIDNNAVGTSTYTWIIVALANHPDNAVGTNAKWLVKANLHTEAVIGTSNYKQI